MPAIFSISHPYVQAYLEYARDSMLKAEDSSHSLGGGCECADMRWHVLSNHAQNASWWRVEYGGVARTEDVADALALRLHPRDLPERPLSVYDAERILAVAALAVFPFPTHPAHWAFWAKNAKQRVAEVVHEVVCEKPQRIRLPPNVPWIDIEYNMLTLRAYQKGWLPLSPRPPGEHSAKVAAKKKLALAKTRTSARRGKKAVAAVEESTAPTTNKNGKRVAAVEEEEVEGSPAKRQKRGVKLLMSPKSKETANSQARTGGGRFTRGKTAGTPDVDAVRTPTRTRSPIVVDPADNAASHSRLTIRITPPSKVGQPPVQPAQSKRTTSSESLDVSFPLSPLTSPPCTPSRAAPSGSVSESASPTPKRPMGRCLNPRAFLESKPDSERSEPSPAPSGTQTAVAGTAMSDVSSTRAGTPVDDDVFSEKLRKTVKGARRMRASCTPERVSVRIKAKRDGSSPESSGSSDTPLAWRMAGTRLA